MKGKALALVLVGLLISIPLVSGFTPPGLTKAQERIQHLVQYMHTETKQKVLEMLNSTEQHFTKTVIGDVYTHETLPGVYKNLIVKIGGLGNKTQYISNGTTKIVDVSPINGSFTFTEDYSEDTKYYESLSGSIGVNTTAERLEVTTDATDETGTVIYNITAVNGNFTLVVLKNTSFYVAPNTTAGTGEDDFNIYISTDNGSTWTLVVDGQNGSASSGTQYTGDVNLTSYVSGLSNFKLKLEFINDGADDDATQPDIWVDDLVLEGELDKAPQDAKVYVHSVTVSGETKEVEQLLGYGDVIELNFTDTDTHGRILLTINVSDQTENVKYNYTITATIFKWEGVKGGEFVVDPVQGIQITSESEMGTPIPLFVRPETKPCMVNVTFFDVNVTDVNATMVNMTVNSESDNTVHFIVTNIEPSITKVAIYVDNQLVNVSVVANQTLYFNWSQWSGHIITMKVYEAAGVSMAPVPTVTWTDIIVFTAVIVLIITIVYVIVQVVRGKIKKGG